MSLTFADISIDQDGDCHVKDAIEIGVMAKIFKQLGDRSMESFNAKVIAVIGRPKHPTATVVESTDGVELFPSMSVAILRHGDQIRLSGQRKDTPLAIYVTCHHDGRVEAVSHPGDGEPLPGPIPPVNPADAFPEGCLERRLMEWKQSGDTGVSSKTMCFAAFGGHKPRSIGYPHDPDDLGRCIRFLEKFPEAKDKLVALRTIDDTEIDDTEVEFNGKFIQSDSDVWGALLDHWDELVALHQEEAPAGRAPKCYARMKELIASVERPIKAVAPRG